MVKTHLVRRERPRLPAPAPTRSEPAPVGGPLLYSSVMSALDPIAFLRATPPFGDLSPPLFERAARSLDIGFFPAGTRLGARGGKSVQDASVMPQGAERQVG